MDDVERDLVAMQWSLTIMARAFRDLAVSFAAVDAKAADGAILRTEKMLVAEFETLLKKPPEGVSVEAFAQALAGVMTPFRDMTQEARNLIEQAGKPKN